MSALMYIRPLRSVWSVPHRLGTFITQRLCTFIMQAAREKADVTQAGCVRQGWAQGDAQGRQRGQEKTSSSRACLWGTQGQAGALLLQMDLV